MVILLLEIAIFTTTKANVMEIVFLSQIRQKNLQRPHNHIILYYNLYNIILLDFNLYDTDMIQLYHHTLISCYV